jgi:two-component system, chemotaxis family, protein-glutamate methylesterase/glutaminase
LRKTRVLVVDDSVVARRVLARTLSTDPGIEVVGTASNGRIALAKIEQSNPDVVTLDIEMPEMDGLETLAALRKIRPSLPAIMFSIFTQPDSFAILERLSFYSVEFVTKPQPGAGPDATEKVIRENLVPRIKKSHALVARNEVAASLSPPLRPAPQHGPRALARLERVDVVVIGISTGGPDALAELLPYFARDFPVSILIAQHMPPFFTTQLAERLAATSRIRVTEGISGQRLLPGHAWLAPGDRHMTIEVVRGEAQIHLDQGARVNSCRPSVDILFQSAAKIFGSHVLAVVMTGMGQDGFSGCEEVSRAGGQILVQDEASSVVWGMPGAIVNAGLANRVLPLAELGENIVRRVMAHRTSASPANPRERADPANHGD